MNMRLRQARKTAKLLQGELAALVGCLQSEISYMERDWIPPEPLRTRVAQALGVPAESLFGRVTEAN